MLVGPEEMKWEGTVSFWVGGLKMERENHTEKNNFKEYVCSGL